MIIDEKQKEIRDDIENLQKHLLFSIPNMSTLNKVRNVLIKIKDKLN